MQTAQGRVQKLMQDPGATREEKADALKQSKLLKKQSKVHQSAMADFMQVKSELETAIKMILGGSRMQEIR